MANFDKGCMIEGFVYSYIFLLAIFTFLFLDTKKGLIFYVFDTFLLWLESILSILIEDLWLIRKTFIVNLVVMLFLAFGGWLLAKIVLLIKQNTSISKISEEREF